jgi:glucose uptake protein
MTILLAFVVVAALGSWIPLAQLLPGTPGRSRVFYVAVGNAVFAGIALLASGANLVFGWRGFWLPLAGGVVWTAGNYCMFKASETIGLARAAGTWTPLNIVVAFAWGALLFGELDGFSKARFAVLGAAFLAVVGGVLLIAGSRDGPSGQPSSSSPRPGAAAESGRRAATARAGLLWAGGAGSCGGLTSCRRSGPRFPPR